MLKSSLHRSESRDFAELAERYQRQLTSDRSRALAQNLGTSSRSLRRLRGGWDGRACTFPMSDDHGAIIGIRRRFWNGGKASIRGSKSGLFIPTDLGDDGPLLICEGPTDAAAGLDLGFDAIGRPNCNSLVEMTVKMVKGQSEIVIVADHDAVGIAGATRLAHAMALHCRSVKIIKPPDGTKDLRQWLNRGLKPSAFQRVVMMLTPIRVQLSFSRKGVRQ